MRLIDADKLKAIIIGAYRKEFFGSVLWNILDDIPTITKVDICREFTDKVKKKFINDYTTTAIEIGIAINDVLAEMENEL